MEEENIIPKFKRKEVDSKYLNVLYEDDSFKKLKFLWSAMEDFAVEMSLSQIMGLIEYQEKANQYFKELMSILTGKDHRNPKAEFDNMKYEFKTDSKSEQLIFNILINISNEIAWIDDVLRMKEYECLNGDE